jgi:imidazolonepropionase-like amidohydrolase
MMMINRIPVPVLRRDTDMISSRTLALLLAGLFLHSGHALASDQIPAKPQDHPIALVGGTLVPVSAPPIEQGTILFDKGKIVAVGRSVTLPEGTETIDVTGMFVYPGLISADTYIGLVEIGAVRATRDRSETGRINPNVRAETAVNPESEVIPVTRANGITMFVTSPSGGLISGTSALMMADGWTWEEMIYKAPAALVINWPTMTISRSAFVQQSEEEQRKEREKQLMEIDEAIRNARAYGLARKSPGQPVDARWEAMIPVLEGKVPVMVWATEIQEIQAAVAWAAKENLRLIIAGGHDAWRATDLLKKNNVSVLAGGIHRMPSRRFEAYDEQFVLPKKLHEAGIPFAIISQGEAAHERSLPYHAATAAAYGLPKEEALKALTLYPAQIFGVADRVGSLDAGKDATLIVTTGDPLEIMTDVRIEFIQGRKIDLTSRHTMLNDKYLEKYSRPREAR